MCNCIKIKIKSLGKFERKLHILEASTNLYTLFSMSNPIDFLSVGKISIDISYFNEQIQKVFFLQDNNIFNKEIIHYPFNKRKIQTKSCIIPHTLKQKIQKPFSVTRSRSAWRCFWPVSLQLLCPDQKHYTSHTMQFCYSANKKVTER